MPDRKRFLLPEIASLIFIYVVFRSGLHDRMAYDALNKEQE